MDLASLRAQLQQQALATSVPPSLHVHADPASLQTVQEGLNPETRTTTPQCRWTWINEWVIHGCTTEHTVDPTFGDLLSTSSMHEHAQAKSEVPGASLDRLTQQLAQAQERADQLSALLRESEASNTLLHTQSTVSPY